ncbi:hypothetical protein V6Z11_A01G179700 [Gossypium hirsutum]
MNMDAYGGWCSSSATTDQMVASFGFFSYPSMRHASFDSTNGVGRSSVNLQQSLVPVHTFNLVMRINTSYNCLDIMVFR